MRETVIVTGGAGFIGCHLVRRLLAHGSGRVVAVDALTYAGHLLNLDDVRADQRFGFVHANIADRAAMEEVLAVHRPQWIVNLAAESHVDRSINGPRAFLQTNVDGTFELLDAVRVYWQGLDGDERARLRFLHVSTDEVYGSLSSAGLFTEATPYAPSSPYAASKAASDHFVQAYRETYGLPTLITNCCNNYGPYQLPEKLIPLVLLNAIGGRSLPIYGDGQHVRDWLYVEDHCDGIIAALERGRPGERYNLGGNTERHNLDVVDRICALLEEIVPSEKNEALRRAGVHSYQDLKLFVAERPGHDRRYAIDASKARQQLGWQARQSFDDGLRLTVCWYLEHRQWCETMQARIAASEQGVLS